MIKSEITDKYLLGNYWSFTNPNLWSKLIASKRCDQFLCFQYDSNTSFLYLFPVDDEDKRQLLGKVVDSFDLLEIIRIITNDKKFGQKKYQYKTDK